MAMPTTTYGGYTGGSIVGGYGGFTGGSIVGGYAYHELCCTNHHGYAYHDVWRLHWRKHRWRLWRLHWRKHRWRLCLPRAMLHQPPWLCLPRRMEATLEEASL